MDVKDFCTGLEMELTAWKAKLYDMSNKIDRLGEASRDVLDHYRSLLVDIGYEEPVVVGTVAVAEGGTGPGVTALVETLDGRFDTKRAALAKAALDVRMLANDAWVACRNLAVASGRDEDALAAATFVSLGVAGYGLYDRTAIETRAQGQGVNT